MFHRLARFLVLIAALQILGGHWAVLQSVAWARMIVEYAERESLTGAVSKTFDGAHPCALCETVSEGRKQEQKQEAATIIVKLDAVLAPIVQLPPRSEAAHLYFSVVPQRHEMAYSPLTPPPRRA